MKICPFCSKQVEDDYRFCSVCGFDFQGAGTSTTKKISRKIRAPTPYIKKVKHVAAPFPPPLPIPPSPAPILPPPEIIDYRARAEEAYISGDYYSALDNYKLYLLEDPDNFEIILARERLFEMLNYKDEAVECLDKALRLHPENRELWDTKSRLLLLLYHEKGEHHYKRESEISAERAESLKSELILKGLCPTCNGTGGCLKCHGNGSCHECGGTGVYKGAVKCPFCNGTGRCDRCDGTTKCQDCHGTGKLELMECKDCNGTGICQKCHGKGTHLIGHCKECGGSGYCPNCKGKGKAFNIPHTEKT